jgi:hypothetical protein
MSTHQDVHGLTSEKLKCMSQYVMKLEECFKPYQVPKKTLDKMIDDEFVSPLVGMNMKSKLSMKRFKQIASELYDEMVRKE